MIYVHIYKNIRSLPFLLQQMLEDIVLGKLESISKKYRLLLYHFQSSTPQLEFYTSYNKNKEMI